VGVLGGRRPAARAGRAGGQDRARRQWSILLSAGTPATAVGGIWDARCRPTAGSPGRWSPAPVATRHGVGAGFGEGRRWCWLWVGVRRRWCRRSRGSLGGEARQSIGQRATVKDSFRVGGHMVGKKGTGGVQVGRGCGWWSS
jgi:hypothetical protein